MRVAGIDCGTNTVRLLIAEVENGAKNSLGMPVLRDLVRKMEVVRLGAGVDRCGKFAPDALERTLTAVREYAAFCREYAVESIRFAATSATRDAANRDLFIDGVAQILGIKPQVISGTEEARRSFLGAISAFQDFTPQTEDPQAAILTVDLGGGSTEFALGTPTGQLLGAYSMDIGSVRMHERHLGKGKAQVSDIAAARKDIQAALDLAQEQIDFRRAGTVIGLAGTVTSITAKWLGLTEYDPQRVHGAAMPLNAVAETCQWFIDSDLEERLVLGFMHPRRADVINAGALVWQEVVARIALHRQQTANPLTQVITSEHDILDGLALWAVTDPQPVRISS